MSDLPLGPPVDPARCPLPRLQQHVGRSVRLEPLSPAHASALWEVALGADASWTYLRYGPFASQAELEDRIATMAGRLEQPFFAAVPYSSGSAEGWLSYCDIAPADAAIEIGSIWFSPQLQRTRAATESVYLLMEHAFGLGYHRIAWRCNALNAASLRAARRFGFTFEGVWREAEIAKGRRRSTAWHSLLEEEWPEHRARFQTWLDDDNFDPDGRARTPLRPKD